MFIIKQHHSAVNSGFLPALEIGSNALWCKRNQDRQCQQVLQVQESISAFKSNSANAAETLSRSSSLEFDRPSR
jgi:hypothetical protein